MRVVAIFKTPCGGSKLLQVLQNAKPVLRPAVSRILLFEKRWAFRSLCTMTISLMVLYQLHLFLFVTRTNLTTSHNEIEGKRLARFAKQTVSNTILKKKVDRNIFGGEIFGNSRVKKFGKNRSTYRRDIFTFSPNNDEVTGTKASVDYPTLPRPPVKPTATKLHDSSAQHVSKPLCPVQPPGLLGELEFKFNSSPPTMEHISLHNPQLEVGGRFEPPNCLSRHRVAFIIPHRDREAHLRALLWHVHPIWQRQQLHYKVYVVHQAGDLAFNKAKLMNIGFLEATKEDDYDCIVFHDVDMLPENDNLLYTCKHTPRHLSVAIDKFDYQLPYLTIFGGVTMVTPAEFRDVNGFSNKYWGWGGEDDDMFRRLFSRGYTITRPPRELARYKMSLHFRDKGNKPNRIRRLMLDESSKRMLDDGLNSLQYSIVDVKKYAMYTNITADVGTAMLQCDPSLSTQGRYRLHQVWPTRRSRSTGRSPAFDWSIATKFSTTNQTLIN